MRVLLLLLITSVITTSCFKEPQKKHYYQIYYNNKKLDLKQINKIVRIKRFQVDKAYKRYNVIYRISPHELFYYRTHLWAVKPDDMVTDMVSTHVKQAGMFQEVLRKLEKRPDYEITGRILALDQIQSVDRWFARIIIVFNLVEFGSGKLIATYTHEDRREVFHPEPVYAIRAMSEMMERGVNLFLKKGHEAISHR